MGYSYELDILDLATEMKGHYSERNDVFDQMRDMYFGVRPSDLSLPEGTTYYQLPTARNVVDMFTDMLSAEFPIINVPAPGEGSGAKARATKLERFLRGVWQRSSKRNGQQILRQQFYYAGLYGWFAFKTLYDPSVYDETPSAYEGEDEGEYAVRIAEHYLAKQRKLPIVVQARHPATIYPQPGSDGKYEYVVEIYQKRVSDVRKKYPEYNPIIGERRDSDLVEWIEYWDEEYYCYWCDRQLIMPLTKHGYGFVPYVVGQSFPVPEDDPKLKGNGLLYGVRDLIAYESLLFSQKATAIAKFAWPTVLAKLSSRVDPATGEPVLLDLRPGKTNYLFEGEDIKYLEWEGTQPAIQQQEESAQAAIQKSTFPDLMYGQGVKSGHSGWLMQQATNGPRLKIVSAQRSLEWGVETVNEQLFRLVEAIGEPVSIWHDGKKGTRETVTISPKDINGYYANTVKLKAVLPQDELQKAQVGEKLAKSKIISRQTAAEEYAGREAPEEEMDQIILEELLDLPVVKAYLGLKLMAKNNEDLGPAVQKQLEQLIQQAIQGGGQQDGKPPFQKGGPKRLPKMPPGGPQAMAAQGRPPVPAAPTQGVAMGAGGGAPGPGPGG
ncbi:MAG: phage portal protein [Patescibacteria group bacterium]|nr:phage portal protein [Patescibacteria group bacterium]